MKILLFPSAVDLAGVSTHVFNLAKLLNEDGLLDAVICPDHGWLSERLEENRIPHVIVRLSYRPRAFLSSSLALLRFLQSRPSADIVHVHGRFPLFISALSLVSLAALSHCSADSCFMPSLKCFLPLPEANIAKGESSDKIRRKLSEKRKWLDVFITI